MSTPQMLARCSLCCRDYDPNIPCAHHSPPRRTCGSRIPRHSYPPSQHPAVCPRRRLGSYRRPPIHCTRGWESFRYLECVTRHTTSMPHSTCCFVVIHTHANNGAATAHSAAATRRIRIARPSTTTTHNGFPSDDRTAMLKYHPAAMITIATPGVGGVAALAPLSPQHTACPSPPLTPQL